MYLTFRLFETVTTPHLAIDGHQLFGKDFDRFSFDWIGVRVQYGSSGFQSGVYPTLPASVGRHNIQNKERRKGRKEREKERNGEFFFAPKPNTGEFFNIDSAIHHDDPLTPVIKALCGSESCDMFDWW